MKDSITLGTYSHEHHLHVEPDIVYADAGAAVVMKRPWVRKWIEQQTGVVLDDGSRVSRRGLIDVDLALYSKHTFYCGATGSGKSRAIFHTVRHYLKFGASVVILEPKLESVQAYISAAKAVGLRPDQVICLSPRLSSVPGFNLFATDLEVTQIAADLTDVILGVGGTTGPRMYPFLFNLVCLLAVHNDLSLIDAIFAIQDFSYLEQLAARPAPMGISPGDALAHDMAVTYFKDFLENTGKAEKASTVGPIASRLAEVARSIFWHGTLGADTSVNMADFWTKQTLCVVHIDQAVLGTNGMKLLSGFISSILYRTAFRATGTRRVFLVVDEAATAEAFLGKTLVDIIAIGRGLNLSVLVACQYFSQLSDSLLASLLSQPAVSLFFRLGANDANRAAAAFATGSEATLKRLTIASQQPATKAGTAQVVWTQPILDNRGRSLAFSRSGWRRFVEADLFAANSVDVLYCLAAGCGLTELYVRDPVTNEPMELRWYLLGVDPSHVSFSGPAPVVVGIRFRPLLLTGIERSSETDKIRHISGMLQNLPPRFAALKVAGEPAKVIQMADVPDPPTDPSERVFFEAVQHATGQSPEVIAGRIAARRARKGSRSMFGTAEEDDDGSI